MEIKRMVGLLSILILTGCHGEAHTAEASQKDGQTEWWFNFFTPKALPAVVTFAGVQDAEGKVYEFNTLDSTRALTGVVGQWNDSARTLNGHWNHIKRPPRHIIFCWDSIIDKRVYQTTLTIPEPVVDKMLRPGVNKDYPGKGKHYNVIQIGLAPEGKVAVWLSGVARGEPGYRITLSVLKTFSGDKMDICKGITKSDFNYGYDQDIKDFIKGKKYPYGNW